MGAEARQITIAPAAGGWFGLLLPAYTALDVSHQVIHKQLTIYGSWVTSTLHMAELLRDLDRWGLHPEVVVSDRFTLDQAGDAYAAADSGRLGKVAIVWAD